MGAEHTSRSGLRSALVSVGTVVVIVLLGGWIVQEELRPWRMWQRRNDGVMELRAARGGVDRCVTCHETHPPLSPVHAPERIGCSVCHGGNGLALDPTVAHVDPETGERDVRLRSPWMQSRCVACHTPGAVPGMERVVRGVALFVGLGCGMCHGLGYDGQGAVEEGPTLRTAPASTPADARQRILDPSIRWPESSMPAFRVTLASRPDDLDSLILFVRALREPKLPPPFGAHVVSSINVQSCDVCHHGIAPRGAAHRCVYLHERAAELRCQNCHRAGAPEGEGVCPLVSSHESACEACHASETGAH